MVIDRKLRGTFRKRLFKGLLLFSTSLLVAVVVAEGLLRLLPSLLPLELQIKLQDDPATRGIDHPYIGNLPAPNSSGVIWTRDFKIPYTVDANGFRNKGSWPKTADVVVIGDSLTFGYGVDPPDAWPALVARGLPGKDVINLGLTGAGPQQYLRVYETFGVALHPKVLLVGVFVANDFWDEHMFNLWLNSGGTGNYMVWRDFGRGASEFGLRHPIRSVRRTLRRHSYLYKLLLFARRLLRSRAAQEPKILELRDGTKLQLAPRYLADKTSYASPDSPVFYEALESLKRIHEIATKRGTRTVMILQPSKEEVYMPLLGEPAPDPGRHLREALDRLQIEYLDLAPVFRQRAQAGGRLFFEADGHPNADGYKLIGEQVLSKMRNDAVP